MPVIQDMPDQGAFYEASITVAEFPYQPLGPWTAAQVLCAWGILSFPQPPTSALTTTPVLFSDTQSCSCLRSLSSESLFLEGFSLPIDVFLPLRAGSQGRFAPGILCELTPLFCSWHFSLHVISCLIHSLTLLGLQAP